MDGRPLPIGVNKKVVGVMKDELGGNIMIEIVALRPKLYSYTSLNIKQKVSEDKLCKGVKRCVVKKNLGFDDYKNCLIDGKNVYREQMMFRSIKHNIYTINCNKIALNRDDDKRIIQDDGITTLARGHCEMQ